MKVIGIAYDIHNQLGRLIDEDVYKLKQLSLQNGNVGIPNRAVLQQPMGFV